MRAARLQNKRTSKVPRGCSATLRGTGANKFRRTDQGGHNIKGQGEFLDKKDEQASSSSAVDGLCMKLPNGSTYLSGTTELPGHKLCPGQTYVPHTKIKLQLFPIDEVTGKGLEKDGHHPYLELTLKARKKISSVIKHLNSKWGNSKIALGEPMLVPYNIREHMSGCRRWTLHDSDISAGDVHASIGGPAIFRLRYGWFSTVDHKSSEECSTSSTTRVDCLQSEGTHRGFTTDTKKTNEEGIQTVVTSEDAKSIRDDGQRMESNHGLSSVQWVDGLTNISIGGLLSEASLQAKFNSSDPKSIGSATYMHHTKINPDSRSLGFWDDSLTNISIGGLLFEASLKEKFSNSDAKVIGSNRDLQATRLISDSLDAFISAQNCFQGSRPSTHDSRSSILDAEETCHAFPFQKVSSSGKVLASGGISRGCSQNSGSKSLRFPKLAEVKSQAGAPTEQACQESETDLSLCSRAYNDESSLGLTGIKWSDSLGPFDLGQPASRKIINGDSISLSGFVK
ncbi:TSL-kinase interacting protein 1 isoform X1 [Ziziphus jujuba]|uniref:TSL-kinase interacting protein 1 isoform X1 n=1 Tax=Ziziphus jujuba TaxID=326968 RepID=A0A6P6GD33_ZIZJJ|nr:TSL-kinase interacting protein 1 isoform X1 [Ziziphus jujuba]XP_024932027.3 TSL-kinase interacting protein 1 isoform X1 [Ziziphus jujuba]